MNAKKRLTINSLEPPQDFPAWQFENLHQKLRAKKGQPEYALAHGALCAISYRFTALAEYDERLIASIGKHGPSPGEPIRYEQERDLFGFFSNAVSTFDAFCFGMFAIGALTGSKKFPLSTEEEEKKVNCKSMDCAYKSAFPGDPILNVLDAIRKDTALKNLRVARNMLTHRIVPVRHAWLSAGGPETGKAKMGRLDIPIDKDTTSSRRREVARLLLMALDAAQQFVETRF